MKEHDSHAKKSTRALASAITQFSHPILYLGIPQSPISYITCRKRDLVPSKYRAKTNSSRLMAMSRMQRGANRGYRMLILREKGANGVWKAHPCHDAWSFEQGISVIHGSKCNRDGAA